MIHIHTFLPSQITHLASLIFSNSVKAARWCPKGKRLAVTTRVGAVYIWDGEGGWVEDGEEVRGGIMEGVGVPNRDFWHTRRIGETADKGNRHGVLGA